MRHAGCVASQQTALHTPARPAGARSRFHNRASGADRVRRRRWALLIIVVGARMIGCSEAPSTALRHSRRVASAFIK